MKFSAYYCVNAPCDHIKLLVLQEKQEIITIRELELFCLDIFAWKIIKPIIFNGCLIPQRKAVKNND